MNKYILTLVILILILSCKKQDLVLDVPSCTDISYGTFNIHPKVNELDNLLEKYIGKGVPGTSAILYHPTKGLYIGAAGSASIENKVPMQSCHLFPSASISKMYAAVMTLMLHEQGQLNIESYIKDYLPAIMIEKLANGNIIKIKHLLNHSSGLRDHENSVKLAWDAYHNPHINFSTDIERLEYIYNKSGLFNPGEGTSYSTSGIILEDMVLESIMKTSHSNLFNNLIVNTGGLNNTYFSNQTGYPFINGTTNLYWDIYGNGNLINSNKLTNDVQAGGHYMGSSPVVFTAFDLFLFMKGIFEDQQYFSNATLDLMKTTKFNDQSTTDGYAYGLEVKIDANHGKRYGHQGGSTGVHTHVYYYENGGIVVLLNNVAGFSDSPINDLISSNQIADNNTLLGEFERILLE